MIACYIRVSTTEQNLASQRREIQAWLDGHGLTAEWYEDKSTGDNLDRPGFARLQSDVFAGKVSTVVIWKLDRLSRKLLDGLNTLCRWCDDGIRVVSVTQQIDLSGVVGKMVAAVLLGVAEMEQTTRRERQAAGIAAAKAAGKYRGRKAGTTKATPKRARELAERGLAPDEIAKSLGVHSRTVRRYLTGVIRELGEQSKSKSMTTTV